jgi:twitching motility protein PilT
MIANSAVRNLIREGKTYELHNVMRLSSKNGMITLDQTLADLLRNKIVSQEEAMMKSNNPEQLLKSLQFAHEPPRM